MRLVGEAYPGYEYDSWAAFVLLDETAGVIRGFVSFTLGKPETWIRQLAVHPKYQKGLVAWRLLKSVYQVAQAFGSQSLEGFQLASRPYLAKMSVRLGMTLLPGHRVVFPLGGSRSKPTPALASADASPSTATSSGT